MSDRIYRFILGYPRLVIGAVLAVTVFFGWHASHVELNNSVEAILPQGHAAVSQDREIKLDFNSREMILIGLLRDDGVFNPTTLRKVRDLTRGIWRLTAVTNADEGRLATWRGQLPDRYDRRVRRILEGGLDVADRGAVTNLWFAVRNDRDVDEGFRRLLDDLRLKLSPVSDVISLAEVDNITATESGISVEPPMSAVPESREDLAGLAATVFENGGFRDNRRLHARLKYSF